MLVCVCVCVCVCALREVLLFELHYLSLGIEKHWTYGPVAVNINANCTLLQPYEIIEDSK